MSPSRPVAYAVGPQGPTWRASARGPRPVLLRRLQPLLLRDLVLRQEGQRRAGGAKAQHIVLEVDAALPKRGVRGSTEELISGVWAAGSDCPSGRCSTAREARAGSKMRQSAGPGQLGASGAGAGHVAAAGRRVGRRAGGHASREGAQAGRGGQLAGEGAHAGRGASKQGRAHLVALQVLQAKQKLHAILQRPKPKNRGCTARPCASGAGKAGLGGPGTRTRMLSLVLCAWGRRGPSPHVPAFFAAGSRGARSHESRQAGGRARVPVHNSSKQQRRQLACVRACLVQHGDGAGEEVVAALELGHVDAPCGWKGEF